MAVANSTAAALRTPGSQQPHPPLTVPREVWPVAAVIVVGAFMTQLDAALVNIGLATVAADLHASLQETQWIVSGYLLALVVGLPLARWGASRLGAGRLWCWALAAFTVTSLLCAFAPNLAMLIAARALQGLSGGLLLPAGQTVIAQVAGRKLIGRVMSIAGAPLVLGPAVGPVVGGELIAHASWPWLFLVNVPVGVVGLWLGLKVIPLGNASPAAFDAIGFLLIAIALPAVTYAISRPGAGQLSFASFYLPLVAGGLALAGFCWRSIACSRPLCDVRLFAGRVFGAAAATSFLGGLLQFGALVVFALDFQLVRGYGTVGAGLAMIGFAMGAAVLPLAGKLTDRFGGGRVTTIGALLTTAAFLTIALASVQMPFLALEALIFAFGIGNAFSVVPASTAAYVAVAPAKMADAVTQINIVLRVGGAVGAAVVVSFLGGGPSAATSSVDAGFHRAFWCLTACAVASIVAAGVLARTARAPVYRDAAVLPDRTDHAVNGHQSAARQPNPAQKTVPTALDQAMERR